MNCYSFYLHKISLVRNEKKKSEYVCSLVGRFSASLYAKKKKRKEKKEKKKRKENYLSTTCGCKQKLNERDGKRKKEGRILYKQLLF